MAKAEMTAVQAGAKAVLKAVARLHPDAALEVLEPMALDERPGMRRRVLLAARIALMRKAMAAPARVVVAAPVVEVVPAPEPPAPPPEPKPLPKGRIMSINLDDLASMLAPAPEPVEPPPAAPVAEAAEAATFTALDWGDVAGTLDADAPALLGEAGETEPVAPAQPRTKASRGKKRGAVVAIKDPEGPAAAMDAAALFAAMEEEGEPPAAAPAPVAVDAAALFAAMEEDAPEEPLAKPAPVDVAALFADMDEAEVVEDIPAPVPPAPLPGMADMAAAFAAMDEAEVAEMGPEKAEERAAKSAPVAVADAAALFAAMEEDAPEVPLAKPAAVDVAAAFAAFGSETDDAPSPALAVDPAAAFAALEDAGRAETEAISIQARAPVVDAGAAFAALEAAEEAEARALAPATGKGKPLAVDLSAQFAAMDDE